MREFLNKYIYLTQPTILLFTLISNFYDLNYVVLGNLVGNSLITNVVFFCYFNYKGNFCWFTKRAPVALILINLLDIFGVYFDYYVYCKVFNVAICFFSLFLFMISVLKKYEYN